MTTRIGGNTVEMTLSGSTLILSVKPGSGHFLPSRKQTERWMKKQHNVIASIDAILTNYADNT